MATSEYEEHGEEAMIDAIDNCTEGAAIGDRIHDALMQCYQPFDGSRTVSSFLNKMKSQVEWCPSFDEVTELVEEKVPASQP